MKTAKIFLNLFIYGLLIPLIVVLLADLAIKISCKYYWGEEILLGDSGYKLGMWLLFLSVLLTILYYIFCVFFKIIKRKAGKNLLTATFIFVPIIFYNIGSPYDFRITISFAFFHITFYALFFAIRFIVSWFPLKKQILNLE
jgi:hypothetical protein